MSSAIDLERQQVAHTAPRVQVAEGAETNKNDEVHPVVSQDEGTGVGSSALGMNVTSDNPQNPVAGDPNSNPRPRNTTSDSRNEEPRMIGDFDSSASEFWKLYRDEAKSHDDARISTLKDGMDSALIFAGLFSAILTAFVVDSKQNLKPSPADQTVYYLQQHSAILSQISVQLSSIAPQVPIPSTPPPPFPSFNPLASDIRINILWFMALTFSLLAALLAILVQQWVRSYMHVFQRYGDPLKSSRLRHYLYEGCEKWNMPGVAEAVPGFLHVSLFLFFAGLGVSLLNINRKVALSTIVPIGVFGLLYIFTIFAPIVYPQSPYQNLFSGVLWYLIQKLRGRRFRDHGDGEMKPVSGNMALGQMQLAMEETMARKDRDVGATRWLINNLTEDAEMETFLLAIPGSFNTDWGAEVWKRVGEYQESEDQSQGERVARLSRDITAHQPSSSWTRPIIHLVRKPTIRHPITHATTPDIHPHFINAHSQGENVVHELSTRVARSLEIYKNRGLFAKDDLWRRRARACVEATASLVFCTNAKLAWFGGLLELLGDIADVENIRELSPSGKDELFVIRWTCLSLVAIRPILEDNENMHIRFWAKELIDHFEKIGNDDALEIAQKIDGMLKKARECLYRLYWVLPNTNDLTEEVTEILRAHESEISELEKINIEAERLGWSMDFFISDMQRAFNEDSYEIISQFPCIVDDFGPDCRSLIPFGRLDRMFVDPFAVQFIRPRQTLQSMCSPALTYRNILEGQGDADAYKAVPMNAPPFPLWRGDEMQRQLLRLQDLRDGGGFGFTVELFFLAVSGMVYTSPFKAIKESHSALFTGTFRAITSDWNKHKDSLGTQKLLLDIAISRGEEIGSEYPAYIVDEFLSLLGNIFEGQRGPHIEEARQRFELFESYGYGEFGERALKVLNQGQAQSPVAP